MSKSADSFDSFWDLASPLQASRLVMDLYGDAAVGQAAACAAEARACDRDADYRFWVAVEARLRAARRPRPADSGATGGGSEKVWGFLL